MDQKPEFRVYFNKSADIIKVERMADGDWVAVQSKEFPIKGEFSRLRTVKIALGKVDPCIISGNNVFCW